MWLFENGAGWDVFDLGTNHILDAAWKEGPGAVVEVQGPG